MKKILFPTAYSTHSKAAFRYALRLAQYFGAEITLVHIYNKKEIYATEHLLKEEELKNDGNKEWSTQDVILRNFAMESISKQYVDIPLNYITKEGKIGETLIELEKKTAYDLVVMGMSRHDLVDRIIGSTSYKMMDEVTCPLLIIPPGASYSGINKIVYGTAFDFGDFSSIDYLLTWCRAFSAKLHALHVYEPSEEESAVRKMSQILNHFSAENKIEYKIEKGKIVEVLESYIEFSGAEILAIHHRKKGFWKQMMTGSLSRVLLEKVSVPVLVLK